MPKLFTQGAVDTVVGGLILAAIGGGITLMAGWLSGVSFNWMPFVGLAALACGVAAFALSWGPRRQSAQLVVDPLADPPARLGPRSLQPPHEPVSYDWLLDELRDLGFEEKSLQGHAYHCVPILINSPCGFKDNARAMFDDADCRRQLERIYRSFPGRDGAWRLPAKGLCMYGPEYFAAKTEDERVMALARFRTAVGQGVI